MRVTLTVSCCAALLAAAAAPCPAQEARGGATAGYDGGLFVRGADGKNELRIGLVSQTRYVANRRDEGAAAGDADDRFGGGVQLRRLQLDLQGHVINPRWTFRVRLDAGNGGGISAAWAWVGYQPARAVGIRAGQLKPSFLYEEDVSGTAQLAAERSYTADYFTTDFSQGVQVTLQPADRLRIVATGHTGSYSFRTDFTEDGSDAAVAVRAGFLAGGRDARRAWQQYSDFSSWSGNQAAVLVSAAVDHEWGESRADQRAPRLTKWSADAVAKLGRVSLFGAVLGQEFSARPPGPVPDSVVAALDAANQLAVVAQASAFAVRDRFEPFVRYEWLDFDGVYYRLNQGAAQSGTRVLGPEDLRLLTAGANWYLRKHGAKLTVDLLYAFDPVPVANTGGALLRSAADGQLAVRTQLQVRL